MYVSMYACNVFLNVMCDSLCMYIMYVWRVWCVCMCAMYGMYVTYGMYGTHVVYVMYVVYVRDLCNAFCVWYVDMSCMYV